MAKKNTSTKKKGNHNNRHPTTLITKQAACSDDKRYQPSLKKRPPKAKAKNRTFGERLIFKNVFYPTVHGFLFIHSSYIGH